MVYYDHRDEAHAYTTLTERETKNMARFTVYYKENERIKAWDVYGVSERDAKHGLYALAGDVEIVKVVRV